MPHPGVAPKIFEHPLELRAAGLFRGFDVDVLMCENEAHSISVFADQG
jgi:hypothetical protein